MVTLPITIIAIWRGMDAKDTKTIAVATRRIKIHYHLRSSTHSLRVKSRPCSNISRALIFFYGSCLYCEAIPTGSPNYWFSKALAAIKDFHGS